MLERIPPQNIDAEQSVLGAILLDREAIYRAMKLLRPDDFYRESHRLIYETMLELDESGSPVDPITVCERLRLNGPENRRLSRTHTGRKHCHNINYYSRIVEENPCSHSDPAVCG